jgi:hypothetical protein
LLHQKSVSRSWTKQWKNSTVEAKEAWTLQCLTALIWWTKLDLGWARKLWKQLKTKFRLKLDFKLRSNKSLNKRWWEKILLFSMLTLLNQSTDRMTGLELTLNTTSLPSICLSL